MFLLKQTMKIKETYSRGIYVQLRAALLATTVSGKSLYILLRHVSNCLLDNLDETTIESSP